MDTTGSTGSIILHLHLITFLLGLLQPSECFGAMPLEALNYLLFCNHIIKPGDLIRALVPDYNMPEGDPHFTGNECQHSVLSVKGDGTKEGILVDLLMDSDEEFLRDFLSYATGYQYMPSSDSFCITVEFNYKEMTFESLPVAHTCDFVLKLPGQGYDGNLEVLKQKLDLSFDLVKAYRYDMK